MYLDILKMQAKKVGSDLEREFGYDTFQGRPVIRIMGFGRPFSFGVSKAKALQWLIEEQQVSPSEILAKLQSME